MFRIIFWVFISVLITSMSSCSIEDDKVSDENAANVDEQLNVNWDLYDAYLASDLDSALFYMQKVREIAEQEDRKKWLANAYWGIAHVQNMKGLLGEATFNFLNAAKVFKEMGDLTGLANVYSNIGDVYSRVGDDKTAINFLTSAKDIFVYEGNNADKASIFRSLSIHFYRTGRYKEAEELLAVAEKAAIESKDYHWLGLVYNSLGIVHFKQKKYDAAQQYYRLTIQYADSLESGDWHKSLAYNNIGEAYFFEGRDDEAKEWLQKAILISKTGQPDLTLVQNSRNLLAQVYLKENNYQGAIALIEEGLQRFDSAVVDKSVHESLALINTALLKINEDADPSMYPEMNKMLVEYNQRLLDFNSKTSGADARLENISQQQAIQAAAEKYAYNQQLLKAAERNAKMKYAFLVPIFLLICALAYAYVAFRRNRHYKRLYSNIEQILNKSKALRHLPKN